MRRNTTAFSLLESWGCDVVERKGDIEISLEAYDLDVPRSEALATYADAHTVLWTEFVAESAERAGYGTLDDVMGPSKTAFADYLDAKA